MKNNLLYLYLSLICFASQAMEQSAANEVYLEGLAQSPLSHKFSPQADKILVHVNGVHIYEIVTGKRLATIAERQMGYKWSPQGSFVAVKTTDTNDEDTRRIYTNAGVWLTDLSAGRFSKMKFSNDERQIYYWPHPDSLSEDEKAAVIVVDPHTGKMLAQLCDDQMKQNKLVAIDPLDKQIAVVSGKKTNFFSRETFAKIAEIFARVTCYSPDGSLMGAYNWTELGGQHSVFNRALECVATIPVHPHCGCYATINAANTVLTAYYYSDHETSFSLVNPASTSVHFQRYIRDFVRSFSSLDGMRRITLKEESVPNEVLDLFLGGYLDLTRVFVTDLADETLDRDKSIEIPGPFEGIFYTPDPNVVVVGRRHMLNLKTCQLISANYGTKKEIEGRKRKIKQLISKAGAYLDMVNKDGDEFVCIRKLDWNKKP